MYLLEKDIEMKNVGKASEEIGIDISTLSRILHKKQKCSKVLAYCIVKYYDKTKEIQDYFKRIGE